MVLKTSGRRGFVASILPLLQQLRGAGFWLDEETYRHVLAIAGEVLRTVAPCYPLALAALGAE